MTYGVSRWQGRANLSRQQYLGYRVGRGACATQRLAASTACMGRFETDLLAEEEKIEALRRLPGRCIDRANRRLMPKELILDLHNSEGLVYGQQESSAYNGHFGRALT